jgi:hypothetical protein
MFEERQNASSAGAGPAKRDSVQVSQWEHRIELTPVQRAGDSVSAVLVGHVITAALSDIDLSARGPWAVSIIDRQKPCPGESAVVSINAVCANLQIAGHSQSPAGIFATTSTRPYLVLFLPLVLIRADRTGGIMTLRVLLEWTEHCELEVPVQLPSPPALVRLRVYPLSIWAGVTLVELVVVVGTR